MSDVRRLVYDLRPPALDDLGLVAALREHALRLEPGSRGLTHDGSPPPPDTAGAAGEGGVYIAVEAPEALPPLPAAVEVAVYRIALEALNNVVRHAEARSCTVRLAINGNLCLEVEDDGRGLPADRPAGIGLTSMQERARELGGQCTVSRKPPPDQGTVVRACLPLPPEAP
jgi:signal transduction histidine kinase